MLTHASDDCPPVKQQQKLEVQKGPSTTSSFTQYQAPNARDGHKSSPPETYTRVDSVREPFHQRIYRHGNPFDSRIPIAVTRGQPLKNKLIPSRGRREASNIPRQLEDHQHIPGGRYARNTQGALSLHQEHLPNLQWREKQTHRSPEPDRDHVEYATPHRSSPRNALEDRQPLGRNLAIYDFPQEHPLPTAEEVLEELREVTQQYLNVDDPAERAAGIIEAAASSLAKEMTPVTPSTVFDRVEQPSPPPSGPSVFTILKIPERANTSELATIPESPERDVRTSRSARKRKKKTTPGPRLLPGTNSRKRNLSRASPSHHGFPFASPILSQTTTRSSAE
ncbi:hypothetical protein Bca4012_033406 [Brassica carinata]